MNERERRIAEVVATLALPPPITIRAWNVADAPAVQRLSAAEGWPTPTTRPRETRAAWEHSWPALVAFDEETVVGFSRALSDGAVTTYIAEILVAPPWRHQGIATALLQTTHRLCPGSRLDLLVTHAGAPFYERLGFRPFSGFRWSWEEELARIEEPES